jgi:uncharacterized metal-binding protein YceD (DUF177 family)
LSRLKEFQIAYVGLSLGKHEYTYTLKEKFFSLFETSEVKSGDVKCDLLLEKKSDMLVLDFSIKGFVDLECDLCLGYYPQEISIENKLILKFGEAYEEQTDEIIIIPVSQQEINVAQYIYEFVHLGLPIKRIHPGGVGENMNCDKVVLEKLNAHLHSSKKSKSDKKEQDARWDELKKLNFDKDTY